MNAAHAHSPTLGFNDTPGQRQAKTCSPVFLGHACVKLLEFDKESPEIFGRNAYASILYFDEKRALCFALDPDRDLSLIGREFEGIREVVVEHLLKLGWIDDLPSQRLIDLSLKA